MIAKGKRRKYRDMVGDYQFWIFKINWADFETHQFYSLTTLILNFENTEILSIQLILHPPGHLIVIIKAINPDMDHLTFPDDAPIITRWLCYVKFYGHLRSYWPEGCQVTPWTVSQVILTCYYQVNHHCLKSKMHDIIRKQLNSECKHMDLQ